MALFGRFSAARRDETELGHGLWRRAHDRFRRALDRFHQMLEGVEQESLYEQLVPVANELAGLLPRVRALCATAQTQAPSEGLDVPAGNYTELHRQLTRAGTALATAAEAVAMARLTAGTAETVMRRAAQVVEHVEAAENFGGSER